MSEVIRRRIPLILFALFYLILTLLTFKHFGETFDESGVYLRGFALTHRILHDDFSSLVIRDPADDGDFYDHSYAMGLYLFNPSMTLGRYHLLNMLFGLLIFIALFEVLLKQTLKPWLSLLGPLLLFLTPRFAGDIPANPKDVPFAVFYFLSLAAIYVFSLRPLTNLLVKALVLGLLFSLAQSCRMLGFTLYFVYLLFDLYFFYPLAKHTLREWFDHLLETTGLLGIVFLVSSFGMILTWPYLGCNYFNHLNEILKVSTNFTWRNNVLFMGQEVSSSALPWYYLPLWFLITTPLSILFFASLSFLKSSFFLKNKLWVLSFCALSVNLILYLLIKPVLYDGLRHYLFFLPLIVVIASLGFMEWFEKSGKTLWFKTLLVLSILNLMIVGIHLVRLHPYEYVYFNELTGGLKGAQGRFDNDYWGASFKEAVEWLERNEINPDKTYKIYGSGNAYQIFCYFAPNMKWVNNIKEADYYISYTRDNLQAAVDQAKLIHVIDREKVPLNYIYKLR